MASLDVRSSGGAVVGSVELPAGLFGVEPNVAVMHQVVTAQLAAARSGTHETKGRSEVSGGGAKPWRQKGTGRARQGSSRAPHWRGGGIVHGPVLRSYRQRTPKKMVRLALCSALSDRAAEGRVVVVDDWNMQTPRTKDARVALSALGLSNGHERSLIVLGPTDEGPWKSFRNLGDRVQLIVVGELNAYDVLVNDWIVFTSATLSWLTEKGRSPTTRGATPAPPGERAVAPATTAAVVPEDVAPSATPSDPGIDAGDTSAGSGGSGPADEATVPVAEVAAPGAGQTGEGHAVDQPDDAEEQST